MATFQTDLKVPLECLMVNTLYISVKIRKSYVSTISMQIADNTYVSIIGSLRYISKLTLYHS